MNPRPIALNGRFTGTPQPTGTQTAAFHLFDAIIRTAGRELPLVVFADPRFNGVAGWAQQPRTTLVPVPFQDWSRAKAQLWEQFVLPRRYREFGCALAHHPINTCPWLNGGARKVVTVHDLNFMLHPEWFSSSFRLTYRLVAVPGIRNADAVVTISDYVQKSVAHHLRIPADRLSRIYNGVKPLPSSSSDAAEKTPPYLLCVGSLQPHKNLARLIQSFVELRREFANLELRVVGRPQPRFRQQPELAGLLQQPGVKVLGYLSEAELGAAYARARLFCYPSLEEGFGLPMLEAMMAGVPVVTSNVSCLPEIAGPAAVQIDPLSVPSLTAGLRSVLNWSADERARRAVQGRAWAEKFSWQQAAREYLDLYQRLWTRN